MITSRQQIRELKWLMEALIGSASRRQITIGMWKKCMHIHTTCLAKSFSQIHTQWLVMEQCMPIAKVHLALRDAIKSNHVGANSIYNVSSAI